MALVEGGLLIGPAIAMGLVLSIIEIGFVHADEAGMHC